MLHTVIALVILYILNLTDYLQTVYAISNFGLAAEVNPVMYYLFENNCAWVLKLVIIPIVLVITYWALKQLKSGTWLVWLITGFYLLLVIHNFCMLGLAGLL
jgi:hypothetical protein